MGYGGKRPASGRFVFRALRPVSATSSIPSSATAGTGFATSSNLRADAAKDVPADISGGSEYTYRTQVDEVNVVFTVTDKHGKFIKDLRQNDFRVLDDNKTPKQIVSFSQQSNLPLRVGLLIDVSNSIRDRFKFEQEAASEFLNQIVRPKSDLAFVLGFDTMPEVTADFTDNSGKLSAGVRVLRPGGGTAFYDAVYYPAATNC